MRVSFSSFLLFATSGAIAINAVTATPVGFNRKGKPTVFPRQDSDTSFDDFLDTADSIAGSLDQVKFSQEAGNIVIGGLNVTIAGLGLLGDNSTDSKNVLVKRQTATGPTVVASRVSVLNLLADTSNNLEFLQESRDTITSCVNEVADLMPTLLQNLQDLGFKI